jgi:hypothetical protein
VFALFRDQKHFHTADWICLVGALVALALWRLADSPVSAAVLITLTDAIAFIPTFRKGYHKPREDTPATFGINGLKFFISLFALQNYNLATWLYPASLVLSNWAFAMMMYVRRRQVKE